MKLALRLAAVVLALACAAASPPPPACARNPGESDPDFAWRVLGLSDDADPHVVSAAWNGTPMIFVDYVTDEEYAERPFLALAPGADGRWRRLRLTHGEQEGGPPNIAAFGFANADRDPARELIVILSWDVRHSEVSGTAYEVRVLDDPQPGQTALTPLKISDRFGSECECEWSDGTTMTFRYKTIAAVKAELKRLGY